MGILIGMDEAGYGPNLGPLVVAATAWEVEEVGGQGSRVRGRKSIPRPVQRFESSSQATVAPALRTDVAEVDLYKRLRRFVGRQPNNGRLAIADSKALYRPGLGLSPLEQGVQAALVALGRSAASWSTLIASLAADPHGRRGGLPWHADFDCPLPMDATAEELTSLGARLAHTCEAAGARPVAMRARLVFPAELNDLTERYGSKGAALSHVTIGLLQEMLGALSANSLPEPAKPPDKPGAVFPSPDPRPPTPTLVVCDKHGGRNRYAGLLQHFFSEVWIETLVESRAESRYHWGAGDGRIEVAFRRGGESFLPAALASMTAKYLRELAMRAENTFWCARVPGLRPTAGYPLDARRFKAEIQSVQSALQIDDHILWRNR